MLKKGAGQQRNAEGGRRGTGDREGGRGRQGMLKEGEEVCRGKDLEMKRG